MSSSFVKFGEATTGLAKSGAAETSLAKSGASTPPVVRSGTIPYVGLKHYKVFIVIMSKLTVLELKLT